MSTIPGLISTLKAGVAQMQILSDKSKAALTALNPSKISSIASLNSQVATLLTRIAALQKEVADAGAIPAEFQSAVDATKSAVDEIAVLLTVNNPPLPDSPDTLAELTDQTVAGVSKRLGPTYAELHPTPEVIPDVWVRPLVPIVVDKSGRVNFSEGLGVETLKPYDYASTQGQVTIVADSGLGLDRVQTNNSAGGVVTAAPQYPRNEAQDSPDPDIGFWTQRDGVILSQPIAVARAHILQINCGLVLFSNGHIRTVNTITGHAWFGGLKLPANKIPLCITLTSQNEFALVGVHDETTGKGEICAIALWGKANNGWGSPQPFAHDWPVSHPGLMNASIWEGAKILGYVDAGVAFPTGISAVAGENPGKDRIEDATGNAGLLINWDLDTQTNRDAFMAHNDGWIAKWGHAVVISKPENKAVFLDLTPLFAAMRAAYFTTQAAYDETKLPAWPYTFAERPAWTPTVVATVSVIKPTAVLVSEVGDASVAIASESGAVSFFTRAGVADGSITIGQNPTCLNYQKYKGRIRSGGFIAACRGDRSIVWVDKTGTGAVVTKTLRDGRLLDPVHVEMQDTHGIEMEQIAVCDFSGRKLETYRSSVLEFVTQGQPSVGVGAVGDAEFEANPSLLVKGNPFASSTSNVN